MNYIWYIIPIKDRDVSFINDSFEMLRTYKIINVWKIYTEISRDYQRLI